MVLPEVVGVKLYGTFDPRATATDLVLTLTAALRKKGLVLDGLQDLILRSVVDKFVEFFGPGVAQLSIADRATVSNMVPLDSGSCLNHQAPEYGATVGFFPVDSNSIEYLRLTGRDESNIAYIEAYLKAQGLFRDYKSGEDPVFSDVLELDLGTVQPAMAGPKRPHDFVLLKEMKKDFLAVFSPVVPSHNCSASRTKLASRAMPFLKLTDRKKFHLSIRERSSS